MKMKKLTATLLSAVLGVYAMAGDALFQDGKMEDRNFTESGSGGTICGTGTSDGIAEDFRSGIPHPQK